MKSEDNLEDLVVSLLKIADPNKSAFSRLEEIANKIERKMPISPVDIRFIEHLVNLKDPIVCRNLNRNGGCMKSKRRDECQFKKNMSICPMYRKAVW